MANKKYKYDFDNLSDYFLSFDNLVKLSRMGILQKKPKKSKKIRERIEGAYYEGNYVGSPGLDIFFFLPKATEEQLNILCDIISDVFPSKPPSDHVANALFFRYLYGQQKNGALLSQDRREYLINEKPDWNLSHKFMSMLEKTFKANDKQYALTVMYEMWAHRYADEVIIYGDKSKIDTFEFMYRTSAKHAKKCKSKKHYFTPYFWSQKYFDLLGDNARSLKYATICMRKTNIFCPDGREGYVSKIKDTIEIIRKNSTKEDWDNFCKVYSDQNNTKKFIWKALREILKRNK